MTEKMNDTEFHQYMGDLEGNSLITQTYDDVIALLDERLVKLEPDARIFLITELTQTIIGVGFGNYFKDRREVAEPALKVLHQNMTETVRNMFDYIDANSKVH